MVYVGMDVHRKRTQVAVIDERGEELSNRNFRNAPGELGPMLMTLEPRHPGRVRSRLRLGLARRVARRAGTGDPPRPRQGSIDDRCGCRRSMAGTVSHRATTTIQVAHREQLDPDTYYMLIADAFRDQG